MRRQEIWRRFVYTPEDVTFVKDTRTPEQKEADRIEGEENLNQLFTYLSPAIESNK